MRHAWLMAVVIALLISDAACNRRSKTDQLAALDSAYQSGVFTKEEYEAKKAALLASSAPPAASAPAAPIASAPPVPAAAPPSPATSAAPVSIPSPAAPVAAVRASVADRAAKTAAPPLPPKPPAATAKREEATPSGRPTPPSAPIASTPAAPVAPPAASPSSPPAAPVEVASIPKNPPPASAVRGEGSEDEEEPAPSAGCEDTEYKSGGKGTQERFFPMPVASVKKGAVAALESLDFTIHKNAGKEIEASKNRHIGVIIGAGGERVALQFLEAQQGGQKGTRMTAETKKSFVGRLAQKSWTNAVLAQTACMLKKDASR